MSRLIASFLVATLAAGLVPAGTAQAQNVNTNVQITDVNLEGVDFDPVTGLLTATGGTVSGTIAGLPFTTDVENFVLQLLPGADPGEDCAILDLELGPIDLDLLGLHVDTSAICLELTAMAGEGLLGDLLCAVAGGDLLQLPDLLDLIGGILERSLAQGQQNGGNGGNGGAEDICDGECEILDLAIGPVDLTVLGLNVYLHNCEDGPVQLCVSASEGQGLLGDLLCGIAGGGGLIPNLDVLEDLLDLLNRLNLENLAPQQLNRLIKALTRALADGQLSNQEINQILRQFTNAGGGGRGRGAA